jgi:hypothetical protein
MERKYFDKKKPTKEEELMLTEITSFLREENVKTLEIVECRQGYHLFFKTDNYKVNLYVNCIFGGYCGIYMAGPFYYIDMEVMYKFVVYKSFHFTSKNYSFDIPKIHIPENLNEEIGKIVYKIANPRFVKAGKKKMRKDVIAMESFKHEYEDNLKKRKSSEHLSKKYIESNGNPKWL